LQQAANPWQEQVLTSTQSRWRKQVRRAKAKKIKKKALKVFDRILLAKPLRIRAR